MDRSKVFISSILNPAVEDLAAERAIARETVESFGFLRAWVFEEAPASTEKLDESYLRHVEECELFIAVIGAEATNPVAAECETAKRCKKPMLVFAKDVPDRTPLAKALLESAGNKYANFSSLEGLEQEIRAAIASTITLGLRALADRNPIRSTMDALRTLQESQVPVAVRPTIPLGEHSFLVQDVNASLVRLHEPGADVPVDVPTSRVVEILPGQDNHPALLLNGRLQWITPTAAWRFFEEKPPVDDRYGFSKQSSMKDPRVSEIIGPISCFAHWTREEKIALSLSLGWLVVYDTDGCYFRTGRPGEHLTLLLKPKTPPANS